MPKRAYYCEVRDTPPKESPWKRRLKPNDMPGGYLQFKQHGVYESFGRQTPLNIDVDIDTKKVALEVSASVVSLVVSVGGKEIFGASGTIIQSVQNHGGTYLNTILTSASILTSSSEINKVQVYLFDKRVFEGSIYTHDSHFNLALVHIHSDAPLAAATLSIVDDSIDINPKTIRRRLDKSTLRPHSDDLCKLSPGDAVLAIGRGSKKFNLMIAPGEFSIDFCKFDCKELMRTTCITTKCGVGGPIVNSYGEVIGVSFYDEDCTPFLPMNIVTKWLEHFRTYGKFCRPCLGLEMANLYVAPVHILEHVVNNFPNIIKGVTVEKVIKGSSADCAGLLKGDIIVECDRSLVSGLLEFYGKIMDKVGEMVEVLVIRERSAQLVKLTLRVHETSPDNFYRWPLPSEHVAVKRLGWGYVNLK